MEERIIHNWDDWIADAAKPCKLARTCKQCGRMESKTEHKASYYDDHGHCVYCNDYNPLVDKFNTAMWS